MSLKRTPPKQDIHSSTTRTQQLLVSQQNRSLSDSHLDLSEYEGNAVNITQRPKRKRNEDLSMDFCSFKEDIKSMIKSFMSTQQIELESITTNLKEIQLTNQNINNSIAILTGQNEELKKKIDLLECKVQKDNEHIAFLEDKLEDMQRESRKANIEIKNVPKKKNETKENLIDYVLSLSKTVGCNANSSDIGDVYRINGRKNAIQKSTSLVVELQSTSLKTDLLKMCKMYNLRNSRNKLQAKHLSFTTNEDEPIFISEHLTAKAARLFFLARDLTKSKQYKYCWTSYGRVYVRLSETSPVILVRNETQIHHLLQASHDN